jgi:hypothetical protein
LLLCHLVDLHWRLLPLLLLLLPLCLLALGWLHIFKEPLLH